MVQHWGERAPQNCLCRTQKAHPNDGSHLQEPWEEAGAALLTSLALPQDCQSSEVATALPIIPVPRMSGWVGMQRGQPSPWPRPSLDCFFRAESGQDSARGWV